MARAALRVRMVRGGGGGYGELLVWASFEQDRLGRAWT